MLIRAVNSPVRGTFSCRSAGNGINDQYTLALALGEPQRLHLEGIIAANFGETGGVQGWRH